MVYSLAEVLLIWQLKSILLALVASSLVAAQTVPSLTGDCVSQCSNFINSIDSCADATDYSCYCNVYEKTLPGAVQVPSNLWLIAVYQLLEFSWTWYRTRSPGTSQLLPVGCIQLFDHLRRNRCHRDYRPNRHRGCWNYWNHRSWTNHWYFFLHCQSHWCSTLICVDHRRWNGIRWIGYDVGSSNALGDQSDCNSSVRSR